MYVLLALGIGLAAGVQALDVALVMSVTFTMVVMTLWRHDIGEIYSSGRGAQLALGSANALWRRRINPQRIKERYAPLLEGMDLDGILLVRTTDKNAARQSIETAAGRFASEWRFTDPVPDKQGLTRFDVLMRLKKETDPADLIADLEARSSDRITAARYVPFGGPANGHSDASKERGDDKA